MNNSTGKTRFICRVVRFQTALSNHASKTTGHAANCPECQAYFRINETLVTSLRRATVQVTQRPSDDLAAKIALAVRQSAPGPRRSRRPVALSLFAGATAALAMAFFVVRENLPIRPTAPKNQAATEISSSEMAGLVSDVDQLRIRFMNSVEPAATKLAAQNPLTQELKSVQADARSALGFLALNFIPSDTIRSSGLESDPTRS
jgi:hypothetical protein